MTYRKLISDIVPTHNPVLVEAWMRSEHGTLDALPPAAFAKEARIAAACIDQTGTPYSLEVVAAVMGPRDFEAAIDWESRERTTRDAPGVISSLGEYRVGHGAIVTDWCPTEAEARAEYARMLQETDRANSGEQA